MKVILECYLGKKTQSGAPIWCGLMHYRGALAPPWCERVRLKRVQRCHFEASLAVDREITEFTKASIMFSGVIRPKPRVPSTRRNPALGNG
ncbi:hypothetical protein [Ralstonia syzygii]|nr:hypothetical protein [Ralstonia syzygii]